MFLYPWSLSSLGTVCAAVVVGLGYFCFKVYRVRSQVNQLREMGLTMPEWSWITGHLLILRRYFLKFPSDTFINVIITDIARDLGNVDMFYLDLWPFLAPTLFVCDPVAAFQVSNKLNLPKPHMYREMFEPINGGPNLLTMNNNQWKYWRSLFNPGFAPGYLMEQIPAIINATEIFVNRLRGLQGTIFCLEDVTTPLTIDIILKAALDLDINYQQETHPLPEALLKMITWSSLGSPWAKYNPIRAFILQKNGRVMNKIIGEELRKRFEELRASMENASQRTNKRSKSVIALTLEDYIKDHCRSKIATSGLDDQFAAFATYQLRLFLFAGHDTVTAVLVYVYHMLYRHSEVLNQLSKEHSAVFGPDPSQASFRLRENPALLNQTPFTLAVIKETMRLFPPAGAIREGSALHSLTDRDGNLYPTKDCLISLSHHSIHRNTQAWANAEEFLPERWLVEPGHELYPPNDAFRPFELGPRMCIGHNLSLIELRIALIMTARILSIKPAYEEWDKMKRKGWVTGISNMLRPPKTEKNALAGDRAYQAEKGGAHPAKGYPCVVSFKN